MIFILSHIAGVLLAVKPTSIEPAFLLIICFLVGLFILRAYAQYRRELAIELGAEVSDMMLVDVKRVMSKADEVLEKRSSYYQRLSNQGKRRFAARLQMVLAEKTFYAKDKLKLTDEMIIMASSAFVQITFGLEGFYLPRFNEVYIYPDLFFNKRHAAMMKGSTSPRGAVSLSWKHLEHGFRVDDDGINVGLHELAHALKISIEKKETLDEHLYNALQHLLNVGDKVRSKLLRGKAAVLRKYAATNEHEFFACAVEVFFENPDELKAEMPELFGALVRVLKQDTTNVEQDFAADVPAGGFDLKRVMRLKPDSSYSYFQMMMMVGLVSFILPMFMVNIHMEASPVATFLFIVTLLIVGVKLFYRKLVISGYTTLPLFIVFLIIGWMPCTVGPGLLLNYLVPVYSVEQTLHPYQIDYMGDHVYRVKIDSEDLPEMEVKGVVAGHIRSCLPDCELIIKQQYGIFGIRYVDDVYVIDKKVYQKLP